MTTEEVALHTTDARVWAQEFIRIARVEVRCPDCATSADIDEGWLIGWFANAIEIGRDAGRREARSRRSSDQEQSAMRAELSTTQARCDALERALRAALGDTADDLADRVATLEARTDALDIAVLAATRAAHHRIHTLEARIHTLEARIHTLERAATESEPTEPRTVHWLKLIDMNGEREPSCGAMGPFVEASTDTASVTCRACRANASALIGRR